MPEQIWFKDPAILFTAETWSKFVPLQGMTTAESLNTVVRLSIYFAVFLFLANGSTAYILTIPIVMAFTLVLYNIFPNGKTLEAFKVETKSIKENYTMPTANNPFMNVLLTEINDDPNRAESAPSNRKDVKDAIYKSFQQTSDLEMDTSDIFDQEQAMRNFNPVQPSTIPGDLDAFKKFLSKGGDDPDFSSAAPSRNGKILSEGYVNSKGSMRDLKSSTTKPTGTSLSGKTAPSPASRTFS
jgi:hypothetical protein